MAPNEQCTQVVTLINSGNITANVRLRLIRAGAASGPNTQLNNRLTLSLAHLTSGTDTSACTASFNYTTPVANWATDFDAQPIGTGGLGLTGNFGTPVGFDAVTATTGKDLWGNTVGADNAPNTGLQLAGPATYYGCMKIAFPSAGIPTSNTTEDNAAQAGSNTYYFVADAIQAAGR
jgi:hypothetical protein